ncbi:MAG: ComF family protein [Myxococcales bacterium]|nr:ComF family protein [Myxococcales bacterium]MCB9579046.1 ComF family protein [Polyangiaceae bacterium]
MLRFALDLVAPRSCAACGVISPAPLCAPCRSRLPPLAPLRRVDGAFVLGSRVYAPPLDAIVQRLKYGDRPDLAGALAELMAPAIVGLQGTLVPVPLHPRRLADRGFNQSALLCQALSRHIGAPVGVDWLVRTLDGAHQAQSLSAQERALNVQGAFRARRALKGEVVLVDDVVTTGATARSCIAALRAAGAQVVAVAAPCQVPT